MDNFPDLFNTNDTWGVVGDNGRDLYRQETSSVDSSTPPPQSLDAEERKNANSIRGITVILITVHKGFKAPPEIYIQGYILDFWHEYSLNTVDYV